MLAWYFVGDETSGGCRLMNMPAVYRVVSAGYLWWSNNTVEPGQCLPLPLPNVTLLSPPQELIGIPISISWGQIIMNVVMTFSLVQNMVWALVRLLLHNHRYIRHNDSGDAPNKKRDLLWMALTRMLIYSSVLRVGRMIEAAKRGGGGKYQS